MGCDRDNRRGLPPFAALRAFDVVGKLGGIRRAAQALGLDHAVVSRHLRALEQWAGVQLVNRLPGSATLTREGALFHARIAAALGEIADASQELQRRAGSRVLSIWCVPGFAYRWLNTQLSAYRVVHPDIEIEFHPTDTSPDFTRYEADIDIRFVLGDQPISANVVSGGVRRLELARPPTVAVASPGLLASLPPIRAAEDLLNAPLLHEENHDQWEAWFRVRGIEPPGPLTGPRLWHAHLTLETALRGQGIALANPFLLRNDLDTGRLVQLFEDEPGIPLGGYTLTARADRWTSPTIVSFRRWLFAATARELRKSGMAERLPVSGTR